MFGEKKFSGVGFPTPLSIPDETTCLLIQVPADPEWWALMVGVLYTLTLEWNWQQYEGGIDRDVAAAAWQVILDQALDLASVSSSCDYNVPAPYWDDDDGDDADDEGTIVEQPWYGQIQTDGVTWVEQVGIWAITAFVAIAATPAAAIAFLPIANRFVLAFHQHDLGGIVKVLINAVEVATVDTYAPAHGVVNVPISLPAPAMSLLMDDPPVMWVVMSDEVNPAVEGDPNIQVIRKRLDQTEITPSNIRWDEDCDCVQQTPDGGETWVDSPSQDPRTSTIFQVPARTGGDPKCDAAQQMHDRVKNMLDAIINSSDILQAINAVVGLIAVFLFEFGIIVEAIWALVSAIFSIGTTTLNAALTDEVYDALLCIFYCEIGEDGTVTQEQYDAIISDINEQFETVAALAITQILASIGFVGLTNAGALGEVTGDCSDCECDWEACLVATDIAAVFSIVGTNGTFVSGGVQTATAFVGGDPTRPRTQAYITATLDSCTVNRLQTFFEAPDGFDNACGGSFATSFYSQNNFATPISAGSGTPSSPFVFTGALTLTDLQVGIGVACCDGCGTPPNEATITEIRIRGTGAVPSQLEPYLC